mmetsp:Transcript_39952/g.105698  ORF Transcript_39952/g.105698 Transcript_39952/m.105698 type:complete len:807 (-) Transcript_39952:220-2640(-)
MLSQCCDNTGKDYNSTNEHAPGVEAEVGQYHDWQDVAGDGGVVDFDGRRQAYPTVAPQDPDREVDIMEGYSGRSLPEAPAAVAASPTERPSLPPGGIEVGEQELCWMNYMSKVMWKYAREAIKHKAKNEMMEKLQTELSRHPELKVKEISIEYDPGSVPPTIKRLRTYEKTQQEFHGLQIDLDIDWETHDFIAKPKIKGTGPAGMPLDILDVAIRGFHLTGTTSVVLAPLVDKEPCFGALQFFFNDPPVLCLKISGLGGGLLDKLIMPIMKKTVLTVMAETFVLPHRLLVKTRKDIPLEELVKVKSPLPIGILEIEVLEARGLPASDSALTGNGSSDPFVEISCGDAKIRTTTVHNTLDPKWSDGVEHLFIYNLDQTVQIAVFDDDALSEDDLLGFLPGYNVYWLCEDLETLAQGRWLKLRHGQDPSKDAGELRVRCRFLDVSELREIALAPSPTPKSVFAQEQGGSAVPKLVTVKLLGMEGEHAKAFRGARARVEFLPVTPEEDHIAQTSFMSRGSKAFWNGVDALGRQTQRLKVATGLGFGCRQGGVASSYRSCKAVPWGEEMGKKQSQTSGISPVVVRAIERLRTRECWELPRIAEMFGISVEEARVAADLRSNFEVVWHQAFHFLQLPDVPSNSGKVRITVTVPMTAEEQSSSAMALVASGGLLGTVQLDLSTDPREGDTPWKRRVRARVRRAGAGFPQIPETLKGEGQCDEFVGEAVPGILMEFLVEVRDLEPNVAHNHLEDGQVPSDRASIGQTYTRSGYLEVIQVKRSFSGTQGNVVMSDTAGRRPSQVPLVQVQNASV